MAIGGETLHQIKYQELAPSNPSTVVNKWIFVSAL